MNQHLFVKIRQLVVSNLANRLTRAGPMSEAIALGLGKISTLIWTVRRPGILTSHLNDPELIRDTLGMFDEY